MRGHPSTWGEQLSWFGGAAHFGGGGSSIPSTTSQTTNSNPWVGQQPDLEHLLGIATDALNGPTSFSGSPQYFPDSTYAPLTGIQSGILSNIVGTGAYGAPTPAGSVPLQSAGNYLSNDLYGGRYTNQTGNTFGQINPTIASLGSGSMLSATNPLFGQSQSALSNELSGNLPGSTPATASAFSQGEGLLSNEISGSLLNPNTSPGFQTVVNNTLAAAIPAARAPFAAGNRDDSGLASAAAAQGATNAVGNLELNNYQYEQGIQNQAAQQAAQNQLAEQGLTNQAASQAAQNQSLGLNATLGAGQLGSQNLLTQLQQQEQGLFATPSLDAATMSDLNQAYNAAGQWQANEQNALNANIDRWNYNQMLPWNTAGLYQGLVSGGYGGQSAGTMTTPYYSNPTSNILSGVTGAATLGLAPLGIGGSSGIGGSLLGALFGGLF